MKNPNRGDKEGKIPNGRRMGERKQVGNRNRGYWWKEEGKIGEMGEGKRKKEERRNFRGKNRQRGGGEREKVNELGGK